MKILLKPIAGWDGNAVVVDEFPFIVGRDLNSDLRLSNRLISRAHAAFVKDDGGVILRDLESMNGTFANNERIRECLLHDGDVIAFAVASFRVRFHLNLSEAFQRLLTSDHRVGAD